MVILRFSLRCSLSGSAYGIMATHTWHHASIFVVFVYCFCVHMYSLIRQTPPLTFSDTAITNCHFDTTVFFSAQSTLGADILVCWIGKIVQTCAAGGSKTIKVLSEWQTPYPLGQASWLILRYILLLLEIFCD